MNLRSPRTWIGVVCIGAIVGYVASGFAQTAPGPLARVHARESSLHGLGSCANCHGGWFSNMSESCQSCHQDVGTQIEERRGLHGSAPKERALACATCHSDHHGEDFAMVNRQSFAQLGVPDPARFDHGIIGFAMGGRHLQLLCATCHPNAEVATLESGQKRFLGLDRSCQSCHADPHEGRMVVRCDQCHSQESWQLPASVGHERHVPLAGAHGKLGCVECHGAGTKSDLMVLGTTTERSPRVCLDCHQSPHRTDFVVANARAAGLAQGQSCGHCHTAEHLGFRDQRLRLVPAQHAASGFPLDGPHAEVACIECHDPARSFANRYPGRDPDGCRQCHKDPHGGQFDRGIYASQGCLSCHDRQHFEPHEFDADKHSRTAFALTGQHLTTDCDLCHRVPARGLPRVFHGTENRCDLCHTDAHQGFFDTALARVLRGAAGTCAHCHTTESFDAVPAGTFDHGKWTGFDVHGAHAQAACDSCHRRRAEADHDGRRFGRVIDHFGPYRGCVTCHQDPHEGEFDRPSLPREVDGRAGCARCHSDVSFRVLPQGFDHTRFTGFPLTGAHAKAECATCHPPLSRPEPSGRTWGRAAGKGCADCHQDPHAGQFVAAGSTDCRRCHRAASTFADLSFRHDLDSRFRLGDAHTGLACAACHKPVRIGEAEAVRYRPLAHECTDCHGMQQDPLRRGRVRR